MKSVVLLLCVIVCTGASLGSAADSGQVRSVYLLPMAGGLDQYLANRIAAAGLYQVVTDPKRAEAVFTDRLGAGFEEQLKTLLPPPAEKKESGEIKDAGRVGPPSTFGRGKGTLFLVDVATRAVLWSIYEPPRNTTASELDRTAQRIVERLQKPARKK